MYIHLDLSGGLTGDMFIAAGLDAFPSFESTVTAAVKSLDGPYPVACSTIPHPDRDMPGRRFEVVPFDEYFGNLPAAVPVANHADGVSCEQTTWELVRQRLNAARIGPRVRAHAGGILDLLVEAEAEVYGIEPERVAFQEVGAWDAIAEILGAAALIDVLGAVRWTASALPLGEVVTLTGASILGYLSPTFAADGCPPCESTPLVSGTGFASHRLSGLNSHMRMLCFNEDTSGMASPWGARAAPRAAEQGLRVGR